MKTAKMLCAVDHITHGMNSIQTKDHNLVLYRITKGFLSSYDEKIFIYLMMDIVGYHIFINLLINHIKKCYMVKFRQFILKEMPNSYFLCNPLKQLVNAFLMKILNSTVTKR